MSGGNGEVGEYEEIEGRLGGVGMNGKVVGMMENS